LELGKAHQCPVCGGTEIVWDRGLRKSVCPKDRTPVESYKIAIPKRSKHTTSKKRKLQKKTVKRKTTTKKTKRKKKSKP